MKILVSSPMQMESQLRFHSSQNISGASQQKKSLQLSPKQMK